VVCSCHCSIRGPGCGSHPCGNCIPLLDRVFIMRTYEHMDLRGERHGNLVAVVRMPIALRRQVDRNRSWLCKCDCGNWRSVQVGAFIRGWVTSCSRKCACFPFRTGKQLRLLFGRTDIGVRRGHLVSIAHSGAGVLWRCDCGNEVIFERRGDRLTCGACNKGVAYNNLIGERFGRLVVLGKARSPDGLKYKRSWWHCICDCGAFFNAREKELLRGNIVSCGCYRESMISGIEGKARFSRGVIERYGDSCLICGASPVECHHLESRNHRRDLQYEPSNGIPLCQKCHVGFHKAFGFGDNTTYQFLRYFCLR